MLKPDHLTHTIRSKPDGSSNLMTSRFGFTLVEMILVIFLLGVTLSLAIPRIHQGIFTDSTDDALRWLIATVDGLKEKAIKDRLDYSLHIDIDTGGYWISNEAMTDENRQEAMENAYLSPDDVRVVDVEFPKSGKTAHGIVDIRFYKKGYSDKVLVHIEDDESSQRTLLIEPFLKQIFTYGSHVGFEE
jgi:prepilin-type N-terminal cleavage/methylation domain-containing protein